MLIDRVRALLADRDDVVERRMVGGRSFMVDGRMVCGVVGGELMVRLGPADYERAAKEALVRPMTLGGRPLKRCLIVDAPAVETDAQLEEWLRRAIDSEVPD